ncbi:MAG TPA: regulator, partial [Rhodothermales bacterium]
MSLPFASRSGCRSAAIVAAILLALAFSTAEQAFAQTGAWTAHTSMRQATSLDVSEGGLWVGTTGGVFRYDVATGEIRRFTIADGLHGIQVRAVAYDANCTDDRACVWIGYQDGVLDRLDPASGAVTSYRDIERADRFARREINRLVVHGDTLFVATSFGLVVFDAVRNEVRDSYTQLGSLLAATPVFDAMIAPADDGTAHLWLATDAGIAHAPHAAPNLKDPGAWTIETSGLPILETRSLEYFSGALFVGTTRGTAQRVTGGGYFAHGIAGTVVPDLLATPDLLVGADESALFFIDRNGEGRRVPSGSFRRPVALVEGDGGTIWVADELEGLVEVGPLTSSATEPQVVRALFPEGPYHNLFSDLTVDAEGRLWAAGVFAPGAGTGVYRMDASGQWTDFIARTNSALTGRDSYTVVHADAEGNVWAGSQGFALMRIGTDDSVELITHANSSLVGASDSSYILIGGIGSDPRGRVWVTSHASPRPLNVLDDDGTWTNFALDECEGLSAVSATYEKLFVDSYGQLWLDIKSRADLNQGLGLLVINPLNTPTDPSDDVCQYYGTLGAAGSGMPGLEVLAIAEDNAGLTWIGTDRGLAFFINNGLVAHDNAATPIWPQHEDRSRGVFMFQGLKINDVAVDPANQVWVATDAGAYLIRQAGSGFEEVFHWTTTNSPLLSDVVNAVAVNPSTGEVFFATDRGLVGYEGEAIAASPESRDLIVYPNPVRVGPDEEPAIFIEGLVEETEILILAPQGTVV